MAVSRRPSPLGEKMSGVADRLSSRSPRSTVAVAKASGERFPARSSAASRSRHSPGGARDVSQRARNEPAETGWVLDASRVHELEGPHARSSSHVARCASVARPRTSTLALTRWPPEGSAISTSGGTVSTSTRVDLSVAPPHASARENTTPVLPVRDRLAALGPTVPRDEDVRGGLGTSVHSGRTRGPSGLPACTRTERLPACAGRTVTCASSTRPSPFGEKTGFRTLMIWRRGASRLTSTRRVVDPWLPLRSQTRIWSSYHPASSPPASQSRANGRPVGTVASFWHSASQLRRLSGFQGPPSRRHEALGSTRGAASSARASVARGGAASSRARQTEPPSGGRRNVATGGARSTMAKRDASAPGRNSGSWGTTRPRSGYVSPLWPSTDTS